jgi:crotonobetainyl-CoA:carnitine CoA-transferase CaiB-like acyl-CoA transferase
MDLKDPEAVELVKKMVVDADVLIESSRPGVMTRLGLGYEQIKDINPRLVYCSISAFGQTGPYAGKAGYDVIAQAFSGFMYYTGEPGGKPTKITSAIGDFSTAINAFGEIMTALYFREKTGRGQQIDVALARTLTWMNASFDHLITGIPRKRTGNHDSSLCPYGIFERSETESIVIGAINVNLWKKLCVVMGREELMTDPKFMTNDARVRNSKEVIAIIEDWLKSLPDVYEAAKLLEAAGIPNCKLYNMDDLLHDPQVAAGGWLQDVPVSKDVTSVKSRKVPVGLANFSEGTIRVERAPALGEHTIEIFKKYGMSEEDAIALENKWNSDGK